MEDKARSACFIFSAHALSTHRQILLLPDGMAEILLRDFFIIIMLFLLLEGDMRTKMILSEHCCLTRDCLQLTLVIQAACCRLDESD